MAVLGWGTGCVPLGPDVGAGSAVETRLGQAPALIIVIMSVLFITLTCNPPEWCANQTLKSTAATEGWHYQKPTTTINVGNSLGPGTTWFQVLSGAGSAVETRFRQAPVLPGAGSVSSRDSGCGESEC